MFFSGPIRMPILCLESGRCGELSRRVLRNPTAPKALGSPDGKIEARTHEYQIARVPPN
jgi:hypothetical protein